jgi:Ala-tRNA(Pro) deacylase
MAICERLQRLFEEERAEHRVLPHAEAFTAAEVAAASHLPGREVAKVVVLSDKGGSYLMVALPAPTWLDIEALTLATGRQGLRLAAETEFARLFPDCDAGAMPPFGGLYGMPLYVDACLRRSPEIVFQAGNHHEVVVMPYAEYERLAQPVVGQVCLHRPWQRVAS